MGIPLGILIGLVSGYVLTLLLRTAVSIKEPQVKDTLSVIGELFSIPTFWFGGPWVTGVFLKSVDRASILPQYMVSLAFTFLAIVIWPLIKLVISLGEQIGEIKRGANG